MNMLSFAALAQYTPGLIRKMPLAGNSAVYEPGFSLPPLIGREAELAALRNSLNDASARLLTLTGPVGVGKSHLAIAALREMALGTTGDTWIIDLSGVADKSDIVAFTRSLTDAVTTNYELQEPPSTEYSLNPFAEHSCTILIDHYEAVSEHIKPLISMILRTYPAARVMAVGTVPVPFYWEQGLRLAPLAVPERGQASDLAALQDVPAVRLFIQYAKSVRPSFALTAENSAAICELCIRLDGLPLAIELAAIRTKLIAPRAILHQLDTRGAATLRRSSAHPFSRHPGITAAAAWAFTQLAPDERRLMARLSVFRGTFPLRAAELVAGSDSAPFHDRLEKLIDKSMLIARAGGGDELTFGIPGILRPHAARLLTGTEDQRDARAAHASYILCAASRLEAEWPLAAARAGEPPRPVPCGPDDLGAAYDFYYDQKDGTALARLAITQRLCGYSPDDLSRCLDAVLDALDVGGQPALVRARALAVAGELSQRLGRHGSADLLQAAQFLFDCERDTTGSAVCSLLLGRSAFTRGDLTTARAFLREGMAVLPAGADTRIRTELLRGLAIACRDSGELVEAARLARIALDTDVSQRDLPGAVLSRCVLATATWLRHDSGHARKLFGETAGQLDELDGHPARPAVLEILAIALLRWQEARDWDRIVRILALAHTLRARTSWARPEHRKPAIEGILRAASEQLAVGKFTALWAEGTRLSWRAALAGLPPPESPARPSAPARWLDSVLTTRELEVARLVAEGMTNRSIARKLGIAEWTVVNHVRKVMRKLDCPSRVHVTRLLAEHALTRRR